MSQPSADATLARRPEPRRPPRPGRLWWLGAGLVVAIAVLVALTHRRELAAVTALISHLRPAWLVVAVSFEGASLVSLAGVQRWLVQTAGVRLPLRTATALTVAGNAVAGALPGGAAVAVVWLYGQYRRRGAGQLLAAAVLVVAGALSVSGLVLLLLLGTLVAGLVGSGFALRAAIGLAVLLVAAVAAVVAVRRTPALRSVAVRAWAAVGRRFQQVGRLEEALVSLYEQSQHVRPGLRPWRRPLSLAVLNWLLDAACLTACLWSLGIRVPWHGLLVAYAVTQITGSLRLTPGSIGIVETSLAALLVLYGLGSEQAVAATLLYRLCSFWLLQPIGWVCWLGITLRTRRAPAD